MWRSGLLVVLLLLVAGTSPAGALQVSPSGRGGGIDGGLPDTTNGVETAPDPPTVGAAPTTTMPATTVPPTVATTVAASTTVAPTGVAPTVVAPATVAPPTVAPATAPATAVAPTVVDGAGEPAGAGAGLEAASTSRSPDAIRSPALLVAGVALALGCGAVLIMRSRRAQGRHYS